MAETAGYRKTSGSKPCLKEMEETLTVTNAMNKPRVIVAKITARILGKSARVIPQKKLPKNVEKRLIMTLTSNVKVMTALNNMRKFFVFLKILGKIVPRCNAVLKRPLNKPPIIPLALRIAGYTATLQGAIEKTSN